MPDFKQLENPNTNLATQIVSSDNKVLGKFIKSFLKVIFYSVVFNQNERDKYRYRFLGIYNAILNKPSKFRGNIK